jgi:iron(III) transport system permease protein
VKSKTAPETALWWLGLAVASFCLLPWYWIDLSNGLNLTGWPVGPSGSALAMALVGGKPWLLALVPPIALASFALMAKGTREWRGALLAWAGAAGLALLLSQGFLIGLKGWNAAWAADLFGGAPKQEGFGFGGFLTLFCFLLLLCEGLATRGFCRGDTFIVSAIGLIVTTIIIFVFFPVARVLSQSVWGQDGWMFDTFVSKITDRSIWGLDCITSTLNCGVAWNTVFLGVFVGIACTFLGLAFALIATRTRFPFKKALTLFSVLPIITPPFVIGLALILIFGRSGIVSNLLYEWFSVPRTRWIYGFTGISIAQILAFTPISFMMLIGVVQGIAPSLEEASQTLRASRWTTFRTITFPLLRPGLANAFLVGFIESLADFGNPLVLGGNFEVLSTKIFFAVVGSAVDESRAAILALVLLGFTLLAFWVQQAWIGKKVYTTVVGKGDSGLPSPLPKAITWLCAIVTVPWVLFSIALYALILVGGFVKALGRDYTPTLQHLTTAFKLNFTGGPIFTGSAWDSLFATLEVSLLSAPLTAAIGLMTAYLLSRQSFAGKRSFEFGTMLSFAIPGTVIGVSYILAFNVPPFELTGTGLILVICFMFRNMPVGVRAGLATLSQIDKSLDEASLTLGAGSATTFRRVILPLLRPAILASLVYSFVRAMTSVSAVIFLVSAKYNMATTYIVGRVEAGEFGIAIAYSAMLIVFMLIVILFIQLAVGERRLGRRAIATPMPTS